MADWQFATGDNLTRKVWAKALSYETISKTYFKKFLGKGPDSLIQVREDLSKGAGDKITHGLLMVPTGPGVQGDNIQSGNEGSLTYYDDNITIDALSQAFRSGGRMSEQRVVYDFRKNAMWGLREWWTERLDTWLFNQLCGYTAESDVRYTGLQATIAPDSDHIIRANNEATDQALAAGDEFTLGLIDKALEKAETISPRIRPLKVDGEDFFVCFIHPYQEYDLVNEVTSSTVNKTWYDIQKAALQGGRYKNNPLFENMLGVYRNVIIHKSTRVTQGVHSSTGAAETDVRRAVFCGAQSACYAVGGGKDSDSGEMFDWQEEVSNYKRKNGISAQLIGGLKKSRFNNKDFGSIVLSTYAVTHTS